LALETKLAAQQNKLQEIERSLGRLVAHATSSDSPKSLLAQMAAFEEQKLDAEAELVKTGREAENVVAKRHAIHEAAIKIKKLVALGSYESRLRLREEIPRKIERIEVFPDGASDEVLKDEPVKAPGWPCFRINFVNGASRWVFCPTKRPAADVNPALLDRY
jgi:hypothetical protein